MVVKCRLFLSGRCRFVLLIILLLSIVVSMMNCWLVVECECSCIFFSEYMVWWLLNFL